MLVQVRKLSKRMRKLEKRYEEAEGQPLKQARLLRMAASTQKRMDKLMKRLRELEGMNSESKIQDVNAEEDKGRRIVI